MNGFAEWATRYCETFGLNSDGDTKMVLSWETPFEMSGYAVAELQAAMFRLTSSPPKFRTEHLAAIQESIRVSRAVQNATVEAETAKRKEYSTCSDCFNSGWVEVPHIREINLGEWVEGASGVRTTLAVACHCYLGKRVVQKREDYARDAKGNMARSKHWVPMSFEKYMEQNPNWRAQMRQEKDRQAATGAAHSDALRRDTIYGQILKRLNIPKPEDPIPF